MKAYQQYIMRRNEILKAQREGRYQTVYAAPAQPYGRPMYGNYGYGGGYGRYGGGYPYGGGMYGRPMGYGGGGMGMGMGLLGGEHLFSFVSVIQARKTHGLSFLFQVSLSDPYSSKRLSVPPSDSTHIFCRYPHARSLFPSSVATSTRKQTKFLLVQISNSIPYLTLSLALLLFPSLYPLNELDRVYL
jgi:hypothetical protein